MKHNCADYPTGVHTLAKRFLLVLVALITMSWWTNTAEATQLDWTGTNSANWSDPNNWTDFYSGAHAVPQNGDRLSFGYPGDAHRSMVNDLVNLTVFALEFANNDYQLDGNSIGFSYDGGIFNNDDSGTFNSSFTTTINCPLVFTNAGMIKTGGVWGDFTETTLDLHLNGPITLNDSALEMWAESTINASGTSGGNGHLYVTGAIGGNGDVYLTAEQAGGHVSSIEFDGTPGNSFSGTMYLSTESSAQITFNKSSGVVVSNRLAVIDGNQANLNLAAPNQIGNNTTIDLEKGAQLYLTGNNVTVGSLVLTNFSPDAASCILDTGSATVGLNGGITASVDNDHVNPIIKGHLNLNGYLPFDISGGPEPGLDIQAAISGNGFSKTGNGGLILSGNNTFFGDVAVNAGTVEAATPTAFGQAGPTFGVHLAGGTVQLENVAIGAEPLFVEAPSLIGLLAAGTCSWAGPVVLNTTLIVSADTNMDFSGVISGTGGLNLNVGTTAGILQLDGPMPNTFTGPLSVCSGILKLAKPAGTNAYSGPLVVGPVCAPPCEVRWINSYQNVFANVTVYDGGFVNLNNNHEDFTALTFNGGTVDAGSGELDIYGATTVNTATSTAVINGNLALPAVYPSNPFIVNHSAGLTCDLTINSTIYGPGLLVKQGTGTMCLFGNNSYTGATFVRNGILEVDYDTALGANGPSQGTTVYNGATLRLAPGVDLSEPLALVGQGFGGTNGALDVLGDSTFTGAFPALNYFDVSGNATIRVESGAIFALSSIVSDAGPLIKTGPGRMVMTGNYANTYTGDTVDVEGTLDLNKSPNVIAIPGNLVVGPPPGGSTAVTRIDNNGQMAVSNVTVNAGSLWDLNGYNQTVAQLNLYDGGDVQTGAGSLIFPPDVDSVVNVGSQSTGSHNSSVISGHLALPVDGGVTFFVAPYAINFPFDSNPELDISAVVSGPGDLGNEGIYKTGQGQLRLNNNNTFAGFVQVNGGTLIAANGGSLGTSAGATFVNNSATLALDGGIVVANETLFLTSLNAIALDSRSGSNTWNGPITLSQPTGISVSTAGGYLQALNTVSGAGGLIKRGPGTLQFWGFGPNTYGGGTTVAAGTLEAGRVSQVSIPGAVVIGDDSTPTNTATLRVDREQQFSPAANVNVHTSGNLYLNDIPTLGTPVPTIGALSGGGTVYLGANSSLTVNNTVSNLFSGLISGPGIFNKSGIGLLRLTADNTYSGTTTVSAGTLQVDGSQPLSAVQLNSSARLQGVGTVGAITASGNSSVVAPGDSPGILTCSNYSASSVGGAGGLEIQLNGATPGLNYDQLNVRGTVSITGKVNLNASLNFSSWLSNSFTIIKNDGVDAVTGTFNGLAQGATLTIGAQQFQISYTGGDGNDVVLTQITGFPRPTLSIQQALAGSVRVLWQTNDPAYTLQSNTNLSTTNWTTVSPPPVISGSNYIVTNSLSAPLMFYRLSKP